VPTATQQPTRPPEITCERFDSWVWAQTVFEDDPSGLAPQLDPDGNGIACENLIVTLGFSPATWANRLPQGLITGELISVIDGDTLQVRIDGQIESVRIYRADTPEVGGNLQCGGNEARDYAAWALGFNDNGSTIYLQKDANARDQYGRYLAYVWFTVDGEPYLLNELLVRSGMANDVDYGDRLYAEQMGEALQFASHHGIGVWAMCGGFSPEHLAIAQPTPTPAQVLPAVAPTTAPAMGIQSGCDPNYDPCVPLVSYDLDCPDLGYTVRVIGYDKHRFDRDNDGWGCE
jgi:endonuclease YncB( thermonuclease family)